MGKELIQVLLPFTPILRGSVASLLWLDYERDGLSERPPRRPVTSWCEQRPSWPGAKVHWVFSQWLTKYSMEGFFFLQMVGWMVGWMVGCGRVPPRSKPPASLAVHACSSSIGRAMLDGEGGTSVRTDKSENGMAVREKKILGLSFSYLYSEWG